MYSQGEGMLEDSVMAYAWLNVAGANGHSRAHEKKSTLNLSREAKKIAEALSRQMVEDNPQLHND